MAGFDLEQYRASRSEVKETPFPVRLGSEKYEDDNGETHERDVIVNIPHWKEWSLESQLAASEGDQMAAIKLLVGDNFDLFMSYGWNLAEFEQLNNELAAWAGFDRGPNSPGPPGRGSTRRSN
jgi:hypothetical protein